jgi:hypothetical protein
MNGSLRPLVDLLIQFFQERPYRSVTNSNEAAFQAVIEMICFDTVRCVPELCLLVDPTKQRGDGRFGFVDLFFAPPKEAFAASIPVLELKNVTLKGLWLATRTCLDTEPSPGDLRALREVLKAESEEVLLNRQFCYWDKQGGDWVKQSIQNLKDAAFQQVRGYLGVLANGVSSTTTSAGICDCWVQCEEGRDSLLGHVIICIGGTHVLTWLAETKSTVYTFESVNMF